MRQSQLAMLETFSAHYVSLHVRVSNKAALHLYRDTLGFDNEKTEGKYYADGEDAYSMRMELSGLRAEMGGGESDSDGDVEMGEGGGKSVGVDEGEAVGSEGVEEGKEKKRRVKVGRGLGVGDLVERNEAAS